MPTQSMKNGVAEPIQSIKIAETLLEQSRLLGFVEVGVNVVVIEGVTVLVGVGVGVFVSEGVAVLVGVTEGVGVGAM